MTHHVREVLDGPGRVGHQQHAVETAQTATTLILDLCRGLGAFGHARAASGGTGTFEHVEGHVASDGWPMQDHSNSFYRFQKNILWR
jgi:hypothetical protein